MSVYIYRIVNLFELVNQELSHNGVFLSDRSISKDKKALCLDLKKNSRHSRNNINIIQ